MEGPDTSAPEPAKIHLADRLTLPDGLRARRYRGAADHAAMAMILAAYRDMQGVNERPTAEQFDANYANLTDCDPDVDIYIVDDAGGAPVAYGRTSHVDLKTGIRDCVVFAPTLPEHLSEQGFTAVVAAQETHLEPVAAAASPSRFRAYASHPGPGREAEGEARWLESLGYDASEWGAALVRPTLDDIPDLPLPPGVEVRPVRAEQIREIVEAHHECFRGEWDFHEPTEASFAWIEDDPYRDETLWQVAWAGDTVVGQVKPFINHDENATRGYLRGYTEHISTHAGWRNQGIAGALLTRALRAIAERGMTEAALSVDTNNPGGAFQLYTKLGFELVSYDAIYFKPFAP